MFNCLLRMIHRRKIYKPRQVPKFENGSDTNTDNRSYRGVFKCSKKDWDMVILPHDKIDTFITANSPEKDMSLGQK